MPRTAAVRILLFALLLGLLAPGAAVAAQPDKPPKDKGKPAPELLAAPVVSGAATQGQSLASSSGDWKRADTFEYQWLRCDADGSGCAEVAGATAPAYEAALADVGSTLRARVIAHNSGGSTEALSAPTARVAGLPPASTGAPVISGEPREGGRLTASPGEWANQPDAFAYQWQRCDPAGACTDIPGADGASYVATGADVGFGLRVRVAATSQWGRTVAESAITGPVKAAPAPPAGSGEGEIVYSAYSRLYRLDPSTGAAREIPLTDPPGYRNFQAFSPTLSPDGTEVIFSYYALDYCCNPHGVAKVGIEGGEPVLHSSTGGGQMGFQRPRFSPDGTRYLWRPGNHDIVESDAATGRLLGQRGTTDGYGSIQTGYTPDGAHVVHDRSYAFNWESSLHVDGVRIESSYGIAEYGIQGFDWAGDRIIFSRHGTIFLLDPDAGTPPVSTGVSGVLPTFSPDGERFAYTWEQDFYVARTDGTGEPVRLTENRAHSGTFPGLIDWAGGGPPAG